MSWYAVYTKSRCEKKVHLALQEKGVVSYCPTSKVLKQWSDRVKKVEQPLFSSYVFVNISAEQQLQVRETPNVVNFVYWQGKPAKILDKEIAAIRQMVDKYDNLIVEKVEYKVGQKVAIEYGVFKGKEAVVTKLSKNKVVMYLPSLQAKLVATIN